MTTETGPDVDIRELYARIRVIEAIQTQMLLATAAQATEPTAFLQRLMLHVENTFRQAQKHASAEAAQAAKDAIDFLTDYSMRLIAALTSNQTRQ